MLVNISPSSGPRLEGGRGPLNVKVDVGKTLALLVLGVLTGVAAFVLFLDDKPAPAATFVGFTSAILSGGFGLAIGERAGASEADRLLRR